MTMLGRPIAFEGTPNDPTPADESWHAPNLGEHNEESLQRSARRAPVDFAVTEIAVFECPGGPVRSTSLERTRVCSS